MRKLILSMQVSLDGFVEGENGDMTWLDVHDEELWDDLFEMLRDVDLLVMGRGMYADYRNYWVNALKGGNATPNEVKYARLADKTPHIVFSNTLHDPLWANTTVLPGPVVDKVRYLKQQAGKSIQVVGGAQFAHTLLDAGLVDEFRLNLCPHIVAKGKSFFRNLNTKYALKLISTKVTKPGVVILRYAKL